MNSPWHHDEHNVRLAIYGMLLVAACITLGVVNVADAQFASPGCSPPTCSPVVIQSVSATGTAQSASINISGTVKAGGCFGATYAGQTGVVANTALPNGYKSAEALCAAAISGSHVCRVEEILESNRCGANLPASGQAFVNGGPPGFPSQANDCAGWTINTGPPGGGFSRAWVFNANGGSGVLTPCTITSTLPLACCK